MASVTSLGIHKPTAIPFLVAEGILPTDPPDNLYEWHTVPNDRSENDHGTQEEELLSTAHCVIWSRGGIVQRVFRFDVEAEVVNQAVFTHFLVRPEDVSGSRSTRLDSQLSSGADDVRGLGANAGGHAAPAVHKDSGLRARNKPNGDINARRRALVVVFSTQAHVIFLTGTSHIVHLPFEVDDAFPLPHGLLLQRRMAHDAIASRTFDIPAVPPNSFALAQLSSSVLIPSSQGQSSLADLQTKSDPKEPFLPFLNTILQQANTSNADSEMPRLYCLSDPLAEVGAVVTPRTSPGPRSSLNRNGRAELPFKPVDPEEDLLYVSAVDELRRIDQTSHDGQPLILVVSRNRLTRNYTIWSVEYVAHGSSAGPKQHLPSSSSGVVSRRRSSYGPGPLTGANSPITRSANVGRDSFGPGVSKVAPAKDVLSDDSFNDGDKDLASHLDLALDTSNTAARTTRRVSSILARADLSSSHDRTTFSDLATGHQAGINVRRGASFGSNGLRLSSGFNNVAVHSRPRPSVGRRSSVDPLLEVEPPADEMPQDADDDDGDEIQSSSLGHDIKGLQKEIVMRKIHVMTSENSELVHTSTHATLCVIPKVFVLKFPDHAFRSRPHKPHCFICLVNQDTGNQTSIELEVSDDPLASQTIKKSQKGQISKNAFSDRSLRVTSVKVEVGLIDACVVRNGDCTRLLVLGLDDGGSTVLSLRAPWAPIAKVQLPASLNVYHPYRMANNLSSKQKRESGFKRVLSQGPQSLIKVEHDDHMGTADVVDAEGTRHRIDVQLLPHNKLVHKMILLCDLTLPNTNQSGDRVLSLWWSAMNWLRGRLEDELDVERTAFVVALFSIAAGYIEDRRAEAAPRQKRKAGLLRSSSGANTNLESWDAMMADETSHAGGSPVWMEGAAWGWMTRQNDDFMRSQASSQRPRPSRPGPTSLPLQKKSPYLAQCLTHARDLRRFLQNSPPMHHDELLTAMDIGHSRMALATILVALHLLREELKLESLTSDALHGITPILAQLGGWLGWPSWSYKAGEYYALEGTGMASCLFDKSLLGGDGTPAEPFPPPSILQFVEATYLQSVTRPFVTVLELLGSPEANSTPLTANATLPSLLSRLTPRTIMITSLLASQSSKGPGERVQEMLTWGLNESLLETLPESVAVPFRAALSACQLQPTSAFSEDVLNMVGRDDINLLGGEGRMSRSPIRMAPISQNEIMRDIHTICNSTLEVEAIGAYDGAAEADRQSATRLVFKEDQRFAEAAKLLHPLHAPVAQCIPEPEWSDTELLEAQQELAKTIAMRTLSVSPGRGCLFYSARAPLLTEKFPIHGFTLSCVMKPSNTTVTADKMIYTEEKVSWAFFHAGVEAGLSIATNAKGIDTSWILFNKPLELKNRHAGFLLALGLNGHLKSIAKWVAFKYLTPKHTMTSIGLLLGLAASYLGTMDTLITRLLSVHVTRMLPPGAAELNLSPLTQTSGIMGIGLLYCNTQHRRMSEIMLSEVENVEEEDPSNPQDGLRDEGYRLAAGFALGYINLGRGKDLKGLHDMHVVERLLALAVGTKKVSLVHILDKGTAAAAVAIALIFMKTHDLVLARKIDIPDTVHQFEYVRPDLFLLRTIARHLIMWDNIRPTFGWIKQQLPSLYQYKVKLTPVRLLNSEDMPFYNIIAGLCLSVGLRFAGTGSVDVRSLLCHYLDQFIRICRLPILNYDSKLARTTVRNCQDVIALAAACVMAGTGDLHLFRRLRSLHGRNEVDIPYGSHLAAHLAIGILFLGGGTHTFSTSNLAVASLLCAFYPLFPTTVLDNKSHLQAFRHFWVLAAEPRCLVVYEVDTQRLVSMPVVVALKDNTELTMTTPCILPEIDTVARVQTNDREYWPVVLDLAGSPAHKKAFRRHQSIWVRRRAAYDAHTSIFSATMQALNDTQSAHRLSTQIFEWVFTLPVFESLDRSECALVLPPEPGSTVYKATRGTVVDDRLTLETACMHSGKSERLWNLRLLFAWVDMMSRKGELCAWLNNEIVEVLRSKLIMRKRIQSG